MQQFEIAGSARSETGKKVKALRRQGLVPLIVYGPKSRPLNLKAVEFDVKRTIARAGGQLIALKVDGENEPRMVLAREVQRDVLTGHLLHVDMYEVDLTAKVRIEVPLSLEGESALVRTGQAALLQVLTSVEIECLPADIVPFIEVDVAKLTEIDEGIFVRDLTVPDTLKVLTLGDELIVKLNPVGEVEEEEEKAVAVEPAEVEVIGRGKAEEEEFEE